MSRKETRITHTKLALCSELKGKRCQCLGSFWIKCKAIQGTDPKHHRYGPGKGPNRRAVSRYTYTDAECARLYREGDPYIVWMFDNPDCQSDETSPPWLVAARADRQRIHPDLVKVERELTSRIAQAMGVPKEFLI